MDETQKTMRNLSYQTLLVTIVNYSAGGQPNFIATASAKSIITPSLGNTTIELNRRPSMEFPLNQFF